MNEQSTFSVWGGVLTFVGVCWLWKMNAARFVCFSIKKSCLRFSSSLLAIRFGVIENVRAGHVVTSSRFSFAFNLCVCFEFIICTFLFEVNIFESFVCVALSSVADTLVRFPARHIPFTSFSHLSFRFVCHTIFRIHLFFIALFTIPNTRERKKIETKRERNYGWL